MTSSVQRRVARLATHIHKINTLAIEYTHVYYTYSVYTMKLARQALVKHTLSPHRMAYLGGPRCAAPPFGPTMKIFYRGLYMKRCVFCHFPANLNEWWMLQTSVIKRVWYCKHLSSSFDKHIKHHRVAGNTVWFHVAGGALWCDLLLNRTRSAVSIHTTTFCSCQLYICYIFTSTKKAMFLPVFVWLLAR